MSLLRVKPEVFRFEIKDFERRFAQIDRAVQCDVVTSDLVSDSRGNQWSLFLGPCDNAREENNREDMNINVLFGMEFFGTKDVHAEIHFLLRDSFGKIFRESYDPGDGGTFFDYKANIASDRDDCSAEIFIKLSELIDKRNKLLVNGSLHIDAMLRFMPLPFHVPGNPLAKNTLELLHDKEYTDISFRVGDAIISAHKLIIKSNAPLLASFFQGNDPGVPLVIKDMAPDVFRGVLHYIYGGGIPHSGCFDDDREGKDIISAADRFGLVELKLAVEAELVEKTPITMSNVIDWLLFADAKTCPLLKERAMAYVVARASDFLQDESRSKALKQSPKLMEELILEISICANNDRRFDGNVRNGTVDDMRKALHVSTVDEIRKGLHARHLDVDGSRETIQSRLGQEILKESNKRRRIM